MDENERRLRVQRLVADRVTDMMLSKPVKDLTDAEVAVMQAALTGAFADEIDARIDKLNAARKTP